jgi:predicted metalloprotease
MRWQSGRQSANVEDRRGMRGPAMIGGGLGTILLLLVVLCLGGDPMALLSKMEKGQPPGGQVGAPGDPGGAVDGKQDQMSQFVSVVLADTEDVWHEQFRKLGRQYQEPKLVLFSDAVQSACGFADAAVGPFYCPADSKVYLDMSFFRELEQRFQAPGDFAQSYVVAHEIGHHVQNQLGISDQVRSQQQRLSSGDANRLSVRLELQADYLAGVWAHHAHKSRQILERGDIEEGLRAATAIGDDRLQRQTRGYVVPDSFTHGTSEQRVRWFSRGLESGDFNGAQALFEVNETDL